jgi:diguanylate cyclase (GGDEF)-like protein/putative nucleotidyltransferase with HDIG domain
MAGDVLSEARQPTRLTIARSGSFMTLKAKAYITSISALGLCVLALGLGNWESHDPVKFGCYFLIAMLGSGLKVGLPSITGTMSVNFLFILIGVVEFSLAETLVLGSTAVLIQCVWHTRKQPRPVQILFNVTSTAIAIAAAYYTYRTSWFRADQLGPALRLVIAASVFFATNTFPVAAVISLTERRPLRKMWQDCYFWSFPYYLVGAALAGLFSAANRFFDWQTALLGLPVIYLIYRSYRLYLGRLDAEKKHAEEMASLHLRTIEALALAIEAKDHLTHDHLQRVQVYALEIGKEMGLSTDELEALRAASVLHDIGKLAVPEHIISKPGKLTPEEFEKMKIHPVVGAEILERVQFPYPVVPIVRAHHEKWNGSGYPAGLEGEEIPIGARILAAVDCLDALASDRQYRRALPLDEAMNVVVSEAGKSFDPAVVEILERRYRGLETRARQIHVQMVGLNTSVKVSRGDAPAAGFEKIRPAPIAPSGESMDFLSSIAAARQEVQTLFELAQDLGNSLSLDETMSVLAVRLKRMIPYDSMAIYVLRDDKLIPEYVSGDDFRLFSSLEIPMGQGLSGWVAEKKKPIINGNPSVEPGYLNDRGKFSTLRSALSVPLEGVSGVIAVVSLYHADKDAFTKDHLRILLAISSKVALSIENALKYRQAETSATTDFLTELPNARSLFLHLDGELARCRRLNAPLALLVCDLDGFKQVNDRFGHLEGNKVLRRVALAIKDSCREYDYVARMGGDEFVLVLPGFHPEDVALKIERLDAIALEAGREVCGEDILSISVGDAHFPTDGADAEQLLAEADRRMYKTKQSHKLALDHDGRWQADWEPTAVH